MWIEDEIYKLFLEKMPIPTVDAIMIHGKEFLLMKRRNPPVKGEWWLLGGRVRKGESLEDAIKREVLEKTSLECSILCQVGVINQIFPECHTISVYYLLESPSKDVRLDREHSCYQWTSELPKNSHSYLKTMIRNAKLAW